MNRRGLVLALAVLHSVAITSACLAADDAQREKPMRIVLVGDSTVASHPNPPQDRPDLTGWGQVFGECFYDRVTVFNLRTVMGENYLDLDALYGLAYMRSLVPDYRTDDLARTVAKHGEGLTKAFPGFLRRDPESHLLLGAVGACGLLNQMMPEKYVDSVRGTDIFSDPRMYQTKAVEVLLREESQR